MLDWTYLQPREQAIRLSIFLAVLAIMALAEWLAPKRRQHVPKLLRWSNNLALVAVDSFLLRLVLPLTAAAFAAAVQIKGYGLLNTFALPSWLSLVLSLLALDLAIYAQHVVFHKVPVLWRLHRMHHADTEIDVTTGLRFHPVEILLSMALKFAVIALIGAPPAAVLLFEIILNGAALFNHSNVRLPARVDALLRLFIVTPDMHRVHHSDVRTETDSNYGFNLPWWDRMFGTYVAEPAKGQQGMTIGLSQFRSPRELWLDRLLSQPLRDDHKQP